MLLCNGDKRQTKNNIFNVMLKTYIKMASIDHHDGDQPQAAEEGESKQVDGEAVHHTIAIIQVLLSPSTSASLPIWLS